MSKKYNRHRRSRNRSRSRSRSRNRSRSQNRRRRVSRRNSRNPRKFLYRISVGDLQRNLEQIDRKTQEDIEKEEEREIMIAIASAKRDIKDKIKYLRERKKIQNKIKYLEYLSRQARQKIISELRGLTYNPKRLDKFARIHEENKRFGRNY